MITIKSWVTGVVLYQGYFDNKSAAVVSAVAQGVNLNGAYLPNIVLTGARLKGAKLAFANMTNADLRDTDLSAADLRNSVLDGADLTRCVVKDTNFCKAILKGAIFKYVWIREALTSGANLTGARLFLANTFATIKG